jgi:hypothetical protein
VSLFLLLLEIYAGMFEPEKPFFATFERKCPSEI